MIIKKILLFFVFAIFLSNSISGQSNKELGNWFMYNGKHKISKKWSIETMAHFRYYEFAKNFQQEIYRVATNYTINNKLNASIGYSYVNTDFLFGESASIAYENRLYEDINYTHFTSKLKFRHRIRFEHRFIRTNLTNNDSHWFRYDLNLSYPIAKNLAVYAFNELFLNLDRRKRFVQNWTGFGLLQTLNKSIKFNIGYLHIKLPIEIQNRLLLGIILNTNHTLTNK